MKQKNTDQNRTKNDYDDDNIPEIDLPKTTDVIPDEVPRRDGPGGE
ncbi:MAG: AE-binding protein [Coprococcus sp.]